ISNNQSLPIPTINQQKIMPLVDVNPSTPPDMRPPPPQSYGPLPPRHLSQPLRYNGPMPPPGP
ncbi:unnamed protein product, partial [Rotaria socialis]